MSDNVAIREGSRAYNFTTDKIRTAQQDSDEPVIWVPESTVQLGSLHASDNGVYLASREDLYGFNEIVVSVNGAATIGDRAVFPDDDGELHEENLPHGILIVTPPRKLEYEDGQRIDLRGLVVKAINENGTTWTNAQYPNGHIPLQELIIDPTAASMDAAETICENDSGIRAIKVRTSLLVPHNGYVYAPGFGYFSTSGYGPWRATVITDTPSTVYLTRYNGELYSAYSSGDKRLDLAADLTVPNPYGSQGWHSIAGSGAKSGYMKFSHNGWGGILTEIPSSTSSPDNISIDSLKEIDGVQPITVSWHRYGDSSTLSTSFDITVRRTAGFTGGSGTF